MLRKRSRSFANSPCWNLANSAATGGRFDANCLMSSVSALLSRVGVTTWMPTLRSPRPPPRRRVMPRSLIVTMSALCVPGLDLDRQLAVEALQLRRRAEDGVRHLHLERRQQVVAVAAEDVVVVDLDLEVEVAVRAARGAGLALAGEVEAHAGVDSGRHVDLHGALRAHPALAGAGRARVRDDRSVAAAGAARARGHHVAEQRTHRALDGPGAAADVAGDGLRAGRAARALAASRRGSRCRPRSRAWCRTRPRRGRPRCAAARPVRAPGASADRPSGPGPPRRRSRRCRRTRTRRLRRRSRPADPGRSARAARRRSARRRRASRA